MHTASVGPGRLEEPIQATARKVQGPLKKEVVVGVAACKSASACWTGTEVYTWGTNNGQLGELGLWFTVDVSNCMSVGYDKAAQPVQILPRKVTKVTQPVLSVSITVCSSALRFSFFLIACDVGFSHGLSSRHQRCHVYLE